MNRKLVYDTFTPEQVAQYAKCWKCTVPEAEESLSHLIIAE